MTPVLLRRLIRPAVLASRSTLTLSTAAPAAEPELTLLSTWFCPYAQRAWIALNHREVPYHWIEALDWHPNGEYKKHPTLLEKNPDGLIPTIFNESEGVVTESILCVQFVDEIPAPGPRLLPTDAFGRARARVEADWVNRRLCSPYYAVLVRKDWDERRSAFAGFLTELRRFCNELRQSGGPFFFGDELSIVDIVFIPYACRLYALEHYRGPDFAVPRDDPDFEPFHRWCDAAFALPSVASTIPERQRYIDHVKKYADGVAKSKVGDAVRAGRTAHELE